VNLDEMNYKGKSTPLGFPNVTLPIKNYHPLIEVSVKPKP
jgi:hypothetical protein